VDLRIAVRLARGAHYRDGARGRQERKTGKVTMPAPCTTGGIPV